MTAKKNTSDYWFTIESYVYVSIANKCALLYNTLDGVVIESDNVEVIVLLSEMLQKENCGVVLLTNKRYKQKYINTFIKELREKYMGDIIDVALSKGKPVQFLPFFNYSNDNEPYKKNNFSRYKNMLVNLSEISIHVDHSTDVAKLITFLLSIPDKFTFNIIGNIGNVANYSELLYFLDQYSSPKNIICSYLDIIPLQPAFENNYTYILSVKFPIELEKWNKARQQLHSQIFLVEYVFEVTSNAEYQQAEQLIEQFRIENYKLAPVYTGENITFFEENVFLSKEDILSTSISIKDIFANQAMNIYEFGKINIMPNGDIYANVNHPVLGNMYTHSIYEIIQKEIDTGKSWFRIRNQAPCNDCVYQWLCPPSSDYEIAIGRPNLCHVL